MLKFVKDDPRQAQVNANAYNSAKNKERADYKTLETVTVQAKQKSKGFGDALRGLFGTVAGIFGAYKGARSVATAPYVAPDTQNPDEKKQKKKFDYILIGGIVLIVVLAIVVLTKKK